MRILVITVGLPLGLGVIALARYYLEGALGFVRALMCVLSEEEAGPRIVMKGLNDYDFRSFVFFLLVIGVIYEAGGLEPFRTLGIIILLASPFYLVGWWAWSKVPKAWPVSEAVMALRAGTHPK